MNGVGARGIERDGNHADVMEMAQAKVTDALDDSGRLCLTS